MGSACCCCPKTLQKYLLSCTTTTENTLLFSRSKDIHQLCHTLFLFEQVKRQKLQLKLCQTVTSSHVESFQRCHPMFLADKIHSPASNYFQSPKILSDRALRLEPCASRQRFLHEASSPTLLMLTIRISYCFSNTF